MSTITYFGKNKKDLFAYVKNSSAAVTFVNHYLLNIELCDIVGKDNNHVFLNDFKSGKKYRFLNSGEVITTQTKKIDSKGKIVQLQSIMIGKKYDPVTMQAFFE